MRLFTCFGDKTANNGNGSLNLSEATCSVLKRIFHTRLLLITSIFLCLLATGCSETELLDSVSSEQSVEVILALGDSGIKAKRDVLEKNSSATAYRILVDKRDFTKALKVLKEYNLPSSGKDQALELTKSEGFIPPSSEQTALRMDLALAKDVEAILGKLPGVVSVAASIRSESVKPRGFSLDKKAPSASVVIRFNSITDKPAFRTQAVIDILKKSVPGLLEEDVSINLSPIRIHAIPSAGTSTGGDISTEAIAPYLFRVESDDKIFAQLFIVIVVLLSSAMSLFVGYIFGRWIRNSEDDELQEQGYVDAKVSTRLGERR